LLIIILTVIGGDFNVVQDYTLGNPNLANINNPKSNEAVNQMKVDLDLQDPWRERNPNTWHNYRNQLSRLDYFWCQTVYWRKWTIFASNLATDLIIH
jgi:hypothetical protein